MIRFLFRLFFFFFLKNKINLCIIELVNCYSIRFFSFQFGDTNFI